MIISRMFPKELSNKQGMVIDSVTGVMLPCTCQVNSVGEGTFEVSKASTYKVLFNGFPPFIIPVTTYSESRNGGVYGGNIYISHTPPTGINVGDIWFDLRTVTFK